MDLDTRMKKVVRIVKRDHRAEVREDLAYWLSRPPEERVATVDFLRAFFYGRSQRFQRVARVLQRKRR